MKTTRHLDDLVAMIRDGAALMIGGFLGFGCPHRLLQGLASAGRKGLTAITNDTARPGVGVGKPIDAKAVARLIASHIGTNPETQRQLLAGELMVELVPEGTLAERIRASAYSLGGVSTKTGLGTVIERDKLTVTVDGDTWLLEKPLHADFALVGAWQADYLVAMTHTAKGTATFVEQCTMPLTSLRPLNLVVTEMAVIEPTAEGLVLRERAPGVSIADVVAATAARLIIPPTVPEFALP